MEIDGGSVGTGSIGTGSIGGGAIGSIGSGAHANGGDNNSNMVDEGKDPESGRVNDRVASKDEPRSVTIRL